MKVFRVYFRCDNCGNKWTEEFEKGVRVEEYSYGTYVVKGLAEPPIKVECPVCGLNNTVRVVKRNPIRWWE